MPPPPDLRRAPEYPYQHVHLPPVAEPHMMPEAEPPSYAGPAFADPRQAAEDLWGSPPALAAAPPTPVPTPVPAPVPSANTEAPEPLFQPGSSMYQRMPLSPSAPAARPAPVHAAPPPAPVQAAAGAGAAAGFADRDGDFVRRFAIGAGLLPETLAHRDGGELAEELGALFNLFCGHLMQLLSARAAAKTATRSSSRTLVQPAGNNPLKFMPTPEEALRVMLGRQSPGYLGAAETIDKSFSDLKNHQLALLSAMQLAAGAIFDELSPDAVRKAADSGKRSLLGSARGKYWETYLETWSATAGKSEHGMLNAFLDAFAAYYDTESQKPRDQG
jgi:type VI secretion system protein ImpI